MPVSLIKSAALNAKNLVGWRTQRKIVVISVDDYGNVRVDSKEARERMSREGLKIYNRFDAFDALETREDLEALYEVLTSVKDRNGRPAVFTPYAVPCNINFEEIKKNNFRRYDYELLPQTYQKLSALQRGDYSGSWELWKEGISTGLMVPQFHGREHLNLRVFNEKLRAGDHELLTCLKNRSYSSLSQRDDGVSAMAAFDFWSPEENQSLRGILADGLNKFEEVFGYRAQNFMAPVCKVHPVLFATLERNGIRFIDSQLLLKEHQGRGKHKTKFNYTGKRTDNGLLVMIRNVVFEPSVDWGIDWVSYVMKQIEAAFRWNRPAIISSHRVNFCGHIEEANRKQGLVALKKLLEKITERWPNVEFMSANELGGLIAGEGASNE